MEITLLEVLGAFTLFFIIVAVVAHQLGWLQVSCEIVKNEE